jgi:hypothetical protein
MRKTIVYILILFLFLSKCDYSTKNNEKDKRVHPTEYEWTIDTLDVDVRVTTFRPTDFLYINENDIYIFGENSHYNDVYFHYDGKEWRDTCVIYGTRDINSVMNISDKIYGAGKTSWYLPEYADFQGGVAFYNGKQWKQIFYASAEGKRVSYFLDIWGDSEDNIWVGGVFGNFGLLYHYNGQEWKNYCLPDTAWLKSFSGTSSDDLYACGYYWESGGVILNGYFFKWTGEEWKIEDQFRENVNNEEHYPFGYRDIYVSEDYIYSCGRGFYRKKRGEKEWEKFELNLGAGFFDISGSSSDNVYVVGDNGRINYWDGDQLYTSGEICPGHPFGTYKKVWTDGEQVFIIGQDDGDYDRVYVLHGK